ncbi:orotidine-5'-phosphate decarboxylase [Nocardioides sp. ChNu-153]|uniref:orotidine-5'-phosphate decarboxylase n=1 Tax=unclassified Nocardioides TaxID=2615069 RepID=UPI0024064D58|nr:MULTISPECIES: orotidine-5'-phosphate decarboxylase [unclassified Nocardioides]MDF9717593.1 orotidine-5'-phosphate decarboxylase [Nocardioides sp. ChNu-99]MDN7123013.1 orotidine-5'-phosphate decarboxylase [Nocardioides sp. ChNu-153]
MTPFGARLAAATAERGPLCAGIDPHPGLLADWGLDATPAGLERFARTAAEALGPVCSVVKPQSAFFERFGSAGVATLERTVADLRAAGALVLLDVKRGDIGSTSQAYADAYLDPSSPLAVDAITASPFLGFGSLTPMVETARRHGGGVFVLALTSNPEASTVQSARREGRSVAAEVLDELRELNTGAEPLGSFGAVVGATIAGVDASAGESLAIGGPLLAPGVGAQGGTVDDVRRIFGDQARHVLPSSSREVLGAGPAVPAVREAALRTNAAFRALLDP